MAHAVNVGTAGPVIGTRPADQAFVILHIGCAALPIIAGLDKFFNRLTNWEMYLAPIVTQVTGLTGHTFMLAVGVIEIVSPGNKGSRATFRACVEKAVGILRQGIHILVIDLFPPTVRDPQGVQRAI